MPQLLVELFSEEIPARMQTQAARDFERLARDHLTAAGFIPEAVKSFAGPRRLTLVVEGLPAAQADRKEERKGPRVGSPDAAIDGFLRSTGLTRDQLVERDGVWFANIEKSGRPTAEIVAEMVDAIIRSFPWPKSMKWGTGTLRWVRPLKRILCVFDGAVVPFNLDGIESGEVTEGHRFMGPRKPFKAHDFTSYAAGLQAHHVLLDVERRKELILKGAKQLCFARNLELVEDEGLLEEVAGLAEWPTPILGDMNPAFLDLPPEVIRTSMRVHQKYFAVRDPATGKLAPHFLTVANIEATDGGKMIAQGNARVLSARLNDARFFWDEDRKVTLESRLEKLKGVTFHAKLGTMYERVERIEGLAREIAPLVGADVQITTRAARLAKADLGTGMVGEFPELQGLMGGYYARSEGMPHVVADAIRDHYKPQGPNDSLPERPESLAVALADKLDTLIGFFAIDERPTGSRDPYALRRAALGAIRLLDQSSARLPISQMTELWILACLRALQPGYGLVAYTEDGYVGLGRGIFDASDGEITESIALFRSNFRRSNNICLVETEGKWEFVRGFEPGAKKAGIERRSFGSYPNLVASVKEFFADRLKVLLREQGRRHDLVDAVIALGDDDIVRIISKVEALDGLLSSDEGLNLLAGYKRANSILRAEEKKGLLPTGPTTLGLLSANEELALSFALTHAQGNVGRALKGEDFPMAVRELSVLRAPIDAFFDKVLVNSDVPAERDNRLRLLAQVRDLMGQVADFSLISG